MSEKASYLRLDLRESVALIEWFWFQEINDDQSKKSSISQIDVDLLHRICKCVMKMRKDPQKYVAMRLSPDDARYLFKWFQNLPQSLIDPRDSDIHVALGMFLHDSGK